tara:strand:+ start:5054 stop:5377 length:324 start_codon:yes stop_codon:yes gene_type:complete
METFNNYSEEQIQKILQNYKNKRDRENKYYHDVTKNSEDFKIKNRQRAKAHYETVGKDMKKASYQKNKELLSAKALYNYYKRNEKIDVFKEKHQSKYILLLESTIIN